ncbi:hypothetical protein LCGC14_3042900, partial [marine sediment metagenome]
MLETVFLIVFAMIGLSLLLNLWRLVVGPSVPDRILALDTMYINTIALIILYGSQTGNSKGVATKLKEQAESRGLAVKLVSMADYKPTALKKEKFLTVVVSTYGEGEPPEDAEALHEFLATKKAPKLDGVKIAVIGLGDSSYEFFCQTAKDFEQRLNKLGAETVYQRADLD